MLLLSLSLLSVILEALATHDHHPIEWNDGQAIISVKQNAPASIDSKVRNHWMGVAVQALHDLVSPCPFAAFGTAIVNHTSSASGELVCIGANAAQQEGDPSLHGEIAAIRNCTSVLTDPVGPYALSPAETLTAWKDLSLYTTAESCPMCASAIRWSGFKEYIYATSIDRLTKTGWSQIEISSREVFERSGLLKPSTAIIGGVLANETDVLLSWQFQAEQPCPKGCSRNGGTGSCVPH